MTASSVYGQAWRQIGAARDAGVGSGAVWIVGKDDGILHYEDAGWVKKEGAATAVAPGPGGALWVVNVGDMNFQAQAPAVVVPTPSIPAITQNTVVPIQPIPVIRQPTQTLTVDNPGATIIVSQGIAPAASTAPPAKPIDPKRPWIVFPRGGIYKRKSLRPAASSALPRVVPAKDPDANSLSPLERAFADIALTATEDVFERQPLPPDQEIARVESDENTRNAVLTVGAVAARMAEVKLRDAQTNALRQWASGVLRTTSLYAAFTGAQAGGAASGAIGAAGWAGVVGTVEGFAVIEGMRVEPMMKMMKLKLGAAMSDTIVIENELTRQQDKDFFLPPISPPP
jgi:hypothetical protein